MKGRQGNNPKRRIIASQEATEDLKSRLLNEARYVDSGHHKRRPADFGFARVDPRPTKSLCDLHRTINRREAENLLQIGIRSGLFSSIGEDGFPKYIWSVSESVEVFEAKTDANGTGRYHGYPLEEDAMHGYIKLAWTNRWKSNG